MIVIGFPVEKDKYEEVSSKKVKNILKHLLPTSSVKKIEQSYTISLKS